MGLPQRIIDFPQHHGTRTLHYFLRKAESEAGERPDIGDSQEVEEGGHFNHELQITNYRCFPLRGIAWDAAKYGGTLGR